jgi:RimJ/RimL family protein N-acetyltransferase
MKEGNDRIVTDDFTLRPWEEEDAERLTFIANNKKIADNLRDGFPYPYSIDDARKSFTLLNTAKVFPKLSPLL